MAVANAEPAGAEAAEAGAEGGPEVLEPEPKRADDRLATVGALADAPSARDGRRFDNPGGD